MPILSEARRFFVSPVFVLGSLLLLIPSPVTAHSPHDPIPTVSFAPDGSIWTISLSVSWRQMRVMTSQDNGWTWQVSSHGYEQPVYDWANDVEFAPEDWPKPLAVAANAYGLQLSHDGGHSWEQGSFAQEVRSAKFAQTEEGAPLLVVAEAMGGVYCSTDGSSFSGCGPKQNFKIKAVATDGSRIAVLTEDRIYVSKDGAATWKRYEPNIAPLESVAITGDHVYVGGQGGLMHSSNLGRNLELLEGVPGPIYIVGAPRTGGPAVLAASDIALYRSEGNGEFVDVSPTAHLSVQRDIHYIDLDFSPHFSDDNRVVVASFEGLWISEDGGLSFRQSDVRPPSSIMGVAVSPSYSEDNFLQVSTYGGGIYSSSDGGESFLPAADGLELATIYGVALAKGEHGIVRFAGYSPGLARAEGDELYSTFGILGLEHPYATHIAPSPNYENDKTLLVGSRSDGVFRSADGGETWTHPLPGVETATEMVLSSGSQWEAWLGTSSRSDERTRVFHSGDRGLTWQDYTSRFPKTDGVALIDTAPNGKVWVGLRAGLFVGGADDGFEQVASVDGPVENVEVTDDGTVFVSTSRHGLLRSRDGQCFQPIGAGLVERGLLLTELVSSPDFDDTQTIFGASAETLVRSTDGGDSWKIISPNPIRFEDNSNTSVGSGVTENDPTASSGRRLVLNLEEHSIELSFVGNHVNIIGQERSGGGTAAVFLDGERVGTIDASRPEDARFPVAMAEGPHRLLISSLGDGPVAVDAFDVSRAPVTEIIEGGETGACLPDREIAPIQEEDSKDDGGCAHRAISGRSKSDVTWLLSAFLLLAAAYRRREKNPGILLNSAAPSR